MKIKHLLLIALVFPLAGCVNRDPSQIYLPGGLHAAAREQGDREDRRKWARQRREREAAVDAENTRHHGGHAIYPGKAPHHDESRRAARAAGSEAARAAAPTNFVTPSAPTPSVGHMH